MQCNDPREYETLYYELQSDRKRPGARKYVPFMTLCFFALNVLFFLWLEWNGSTEDGSFMMEHGTMVPFLVVEWKQYYRLVTACFMHFGISHLFNNMLLLCYLGVRLEKYMGHVKFAILYLICGVGGNVLSLIFYMLTDPYVNSAGASGAVFGVVGGILWVVLRHKGRLADLTSRQLLMMIIFSLYSGFSDGGINNAAHIGGLILGFLLGMLFYRGGQSFFRKKEPEDLWYDLS